MKAYLDNVIVCAIGKRDLASAVEMHALDQLTSGQYLDRCEVVTSRWSLREIDRTRDQTVREKLTAAFRQLKIVVDDHRVLGFHIQEDQLAGCISNPLVSDVIDQKVFDDLQQLGLVKGDPYHLMVAHGNRCDLFVTTDPDFLDRRDDLHARLSAIRIVLPSELVAELSASGA